MAINKECREYLRLKEESLTRQLEAFEKIIAKPPSRCEK